MTHVPLNQIHAEIEFFEKRLATLAEDEAGLVDSLRHIDIDLSNTLDEFVDTTGRPAADFYTWRRKAKWARFYKERELESKREEMLLAKQKLTNAQMEKLAIEAGYRGDDPESLLRAMYHLMMDVVGRAKVTLDPHQIGLLAEVRRRADDTIT